MKEKRKNWPNDWHLHVSKTFEFYFFDKKIEFIRCDSYFTLVTDATTENIDGYTYQENYLLIDLKIKNISYSLIITFEKNKLIIRLYVLNKRNDYYLMIGVKKFESKKPFDCVKTTEKLILNDYLYRNQKEDGHGNEGGGGGDIENPKNPPPILPGKTLSPLFL